MFTYDSGVLSGSLDLGSSCHINDGHIYEFAVIVCHKTQWAVVSKNLNARRGTSSYGRCSWNTQQGYHGIFCEIICMDCTVPLQLPTGVILWKRRANVRRRYIVMSSLIGWSLSGMHAISCINCWYEKSFAFSLRARIHYNDMSYWPLDNYRSGWLSSTLMFWLIWCWNLGFVETIRISSTYTASTLYFEGWLRIHN